MITRRRFFQRATRVAGAAFAFSVPVEALDALPPGHIAAAISETAGIDAFAGNDPLVVDVIERYARQFPQLEVDRKSPECLHVTSKRGMLIVLQDDRQTWITFMGGPQRDVDREALAISAGGFMSSLMDWRFDHE